MSHVADSRKNRPFDPISGPFQGVLPPSGPRIMGAEEATHFLAQRKRGWPLSTLFLDTAALTATRHHAAVRRNQRGQAVRRPSR